MATIIEGAQYALTSPIEKNHSVVFVKLTDSALKAIEDYALAISKGNASNSVSPLIELRPNNSQGIITIPNKLNDNNNNSRKDDDNEKQSYNFSVKDIQNDGILECVKQTNSKMCMESLGKILLRMQIHANDDVYQSTKVKMAVAAEQEMKKYNTKVIDLGRKTKSSKKPFNSKFNHGGYNNANNNSNTNNNCTSNATASNSLTFFNTNNNNSKNTLPRFNKYSNGNLPSQLQQQQQQPPPPSSSSSSQPSKNVNYNSANNFHMNNGEINKKMRDAVIQLLSTKSYKLVDILSKIQERFSKEPIDKNMLMNILNSVATFKDGIYHSNETINGGGAAGGAAAADEVQFDKEDREVNQTKQQRIPSVQTGLLDFPKYNNSLIINNNNNNNNTNTNNTNNNSYISNHGGCPVSNGNSISPFSDTSVRSLSSPNSLNASPSNKSNSPFAKTNNVKRNPDFSPIVSNNTKKFKNEDSRSTKSQQLNANNNNSAMSNYSPLDRIQNSMDNDSPDLRIPYKSTTNQPLLSDAFNLLNNNTNGNHKSNEKESSSQTNQTQRNYSTGSGSMNSSPDSSPDSGISHIGNMFSSDSSFNTETEDYLAKYPRIQDMNQYLKYKSDFNAEFPEYKKLYDYVTSITRQFKDYKELINTKEEESDEWHELIKTIFEKYDEVKKKTKYQKAHKRLLYLHQKLTHIKNMINEYLMNNNHNNN